jgi:hypothetical protein
LKAKIWNWNWNWNCWAPATTWPRFEIDPPKLVFSLYGGFDSTFFLKN